MCSTFNLSMAPLTQVLLIIFLAIVFQQVCVTKSETRVTRSDVREVLRGQIDPAFWPTRGRRGGSSEESEPPFWANRGRSESKEEEQPPFWGNRGRELEDYRSKFQGPPIERNVPTIVPKFTLADLMKWANTLKRQDIGYFCDSMNKGNYRMYVDEPHYILLNRRGVMDDNDDHYWTSRGRREAVVKRSPKQRLNREFSPLDEGAGEKMTNSELKPDSYPPIHGNAEDTRFWKTLATKMGDKETTTVVKNVLGTRSDE